MINRTRMGGLTLTLAIAYAMTTCCSSTMASAAVQGGAPNLKGVTITVGEQASYISTMLKAAGQADTPYTLKFAEFQSGPLAATALNAGEIDVAAAGGPAIPFAIAGGGKPSYKIVADFAYVGGGEPDANVAVPEGSQITTIKGLKGKKVAVDFGSAPQYALLGLLKKAGLRWSNIKPINLPPASAAAAFASGSVDAMAGADSAIGPLVEKGKATLLARGSKITSPGYFVAASNAAINDKQKNAAIKDFVQRWAKANVWANSHTSVWGPIWEQAVNIPAEVGKYVIQGSKFVYRPWNSVALEDAQNEVDAFASVGLIKKININKYIYTGFNGKIRVS